MYQIKLSFKSHAHTLSKPEVHRTMLHCMVVMKNIQNHTKNLLLLDFFFFLKQITCLITHDQAEFWYYITLIV